MKRLMILTVGVCLLIAAVPAIADQAADEAAIRAATKQAIETANKRDMEAHLAVYADSFVSFGGKRDPAAHRKIHTDGWAGQKDGRTKLLKEIDVVFLSPNIAIQTFQVEGTGWLDENGKTEPPSKTTYARVYEKKNGKWLIVGNFMRAVTE
jgi:ketosteroid isomerase-like protein